MYFFLRQTIQKRPHLSQLLGTMGVILVALAHHVAMATGAAKWVGGVCGGGGAG